MKTTIEIQREFESLVLQLERLRSINELTSTNAESTERVINKIDLFIASANQLKLSIDEDINAKSAQISEMVSHLNTSIEYIENRAENVLIEHSRKIEGLHEKSGIAIINHQNVLSNKLGEFYDNINNDVVTRNAQISDVLSRLEVFVESIESNITGILTEHTNEVKDIHDRSDIAFTATQEALSQELQRFYTTLSNLNEAFENSLNSSHSSIINELIRRTDLLERQVNNKVEEVNEVLIKNIKINKGVKSIIIYGGVFIIILLGLILYKVL